MTTQITLNPFVVYFLNGSDVLFAKSYKTSRAAKGQLTKLRKREDLKVWTECGVHLATELESNDAIFQAAAKLLTPSK